MHYHNQDHFYNAVSQFSHNLITVNFMPKENNQSKKKFKRYDHIKCVVCGDSSSGHHYGAFTCEACKLFFIRTERNVGKFHECKTGNCNISVEKRKSCSACRYKACIASGMDMNRRKYGRHTDDMQALGGQYLPNVSVTLTQAYQQLFNLFQNSLINNFSVENASCLFNDFFEKSKIIIGVKQVKHPETVEKDESVNKQCLDIMLIAIFFNLFDLTNISFQTSLYQQFSHDLNEIHKKIKEQLHGNEFNLMLKISTFVYIMQSIEIIKNQQALIFLKDDACKKKLVDLIKSEFIAFRFKAETNEEKTDSSCYLYAFLLSITEIEILIKQYLYLF